MSLMNTIISIFCKKGKRIFKEVNINEYKNIRDNEQKQVRYCKLSKNVNRLITRFDSYTFQVLTKISNPQDIMIYYIHGGGFVMGSSNARIMFISYLVNNIGYNVTSIDYPLAPEHPFPEGLNACVKGYKKLLEKYDSKNIILIGESAGGNLVLSTLLKIKALNLPYPLMTFSLSPCVQFDKTLESYIKNDKSEAMVANLSEEVIATYLNNDKSLLLNPLVSPLYGNFEGLTPIHLFASTSEKLLDDSKLMYEKLLKNNVKTSLTLRKGMVHTRIVIPYIPEAKKDLKTIKNMIKEEIDKKVKE